jgi:acyl-CoA reductase-like NAD-dependent aldehyde dehydrogenase
VSEADATNLVGGSWRRPRGAGTYETRDPATGKVLHRYTVSSIGDVDDAVAAATAAYEACRRQPAPARGRLLHRIADELEVVKEELAHEMTREMGKVLRESLGEVDVAIGSCRFMAGEGLRAFGEVLPSSMSDRDIFTMRSPVGVVACITPWNFPVSLAAYKISAAIASGNTVVWKPAPNTSGSARLFTDAMVRAGMPAGLVNLLSAGGVEVGRRLSTHADVAAVTFTGSTAVGLRVAESCSRTLTPVALELGGKNAAIVLADADMDAAVDGIIQSAFATTGQRCTATSRVIVDRAVGQHLTAMLVQRCADLKLGSGLDDAADMGPIASTAQLAKIVALVDQAAESGAQVLCGGAPAVVAGLPQGLFYPPTVLAGVRPDDDIAQTEVFGPVVAVIEVDGYEEAVEANNKTQYGLSSSIFTRDLGYAHRAMRDLASGVVYVNSGTSAAELGVPFGGIRLSGNGHREVSTDAFDVMTELKSVYVKF